MVKNKIFKNVFFSSFLGIILIFLYFFSSSPEKPQPVKTPEPPPLPPDRILSGKIERGNTLSSVLQAQNLPSDLVAAICKNLKPMVNLRQVKPGDSFEVRFTPGGQLRSFSYQTSPIDIYQITAQPSGEWDCQKKEENTASFSLKKRF